MGASVHRGRNPMMAICRLLDSPQFVTGVNSASTTAIARFLFVSGFAKARIVRLPRRQVPPSVSDLSPEAGSDLEAVPDDCGLHSNPSHKRYLRLERILKPTTVSILAPIGIAERSKKKSGL